MIEFGEPNPHGFIHRGRPLRGHDDLSAQERLEPFWPTPAKPASAAEDVWLHGALDSAMIATMRPTHNWLWALGTLVIWAAIMLAFLLIAISRA